MEKDLLQRKLNIIQKYQSAFAAILPEHLQHGKALVLDLSEKSQQFSQETLFSPEIAWQETQKLMAKYQADIAIGQYAEHRMMYQRSNLYQINTAENEFRCIHLGIDLTVAEGTLVSAPYDAMIHSFQNNDNDADYGPTIILEHHIEDISFYTLYGHLSLASLDSLQKDQSLARGEAFAAIGNLTENGHWPPHLHFQIILDIGDYQGDYPGVCSQQEADHYLKNCPNPNLILNIANI